MEVQENGDVKRKRRNFMDRSVEVWIGIILDEDVIGKDYYDKIKGMV